MRAEPNRIAALAGIGAVVFQVAGVFFASQVEAAYRPGTLDRWFYAVNQHEEATAFGAWALALGSFLLVPWAAGVARAVGPYAWPGSAMIAAAGVVQGGAALGPFVVVHYLPHGEEALGQTLLGMTLLGASVYAAVMGVGVVLLSLGMARALAFPMWLSGWGLLAGLLATGAVAQAWSPVGADFVFLADPILGAWVFVSCLVLAAVQRAGTEEESPARSLAPPHQPTRSWPVGPVPGGVPPVIPVPEPSERAASAK